MPAETGLTKDQAQARVDRIRAFQDELKRLESDGVFRLPDGDRERLAAYHEEVIRNLSERFDVDRSEAQKQMSLGMRVASFLGALAFSIACFLFFYRFWGALSVALQVFILALAPILATAGMEIAARREKTMYVASILGLVAIACFVLDVSVLASIFNITPSPYGLLLWGGFALILAYTYRLRVLLFIGIVLAAGSVGALFAVLGGVEWTAFGARPEGVVLAGALAIGVSVFEQRRGAAGFASVYRLTGWVMLLFPLLLLSQNAAFSFLPLPAAAVRRIYDVTAVTAGGLALWSGVSRRGLDVANTGTLFLAIFLLLKLFDWLWAWMPRYLFFFLIGMVAIGVLVMLQRLRRRFGR